MPRPAVLAVIIIGLTAVVVASAFAPNHHHPQSSVPRRSFELRYTSGDYLSQLASRSAAAVATPPVETAPQPPPSSSAATATTTTTYSTSSPVVVVVPTPTPSSRTLAAAAATSSAITLYPIVANFAAAAAAAMVPTPASWESGGQRDDAFSYASRSSFELDLLTAKGFRENADVGQPHESSRHLIDLGAISVGSWYCSEGGWPSLSQRSTTEVFHVFRGHGCLTDMDGMRHFFGPGDTIILPKGWAGRWDIQEAVHKVWCVNDHAHIEETSFPIRAVTVPHHQLVAPEILQKHGLRSDAIHGTPYTASQLVYSVGPSTIVGCWSCTPGSFPIQNLSNTQFFHVLEGVFFVTNPDGSARRCAAGDTVVLPKGWSGMFDVVETVRKLNVVVQ